MTTLRRLNSTQIDFSYNYGPCPCSLLNSLERTLSRNLEVDKYAPLEDSFKKFVIKGVLAENGSEDLIDSIYQSANVSHVQT